jgi:hypothetical protein
VVATTGSLDRKTLDLMSPAEQWARDQQALVAEVTDVDVQQMVRFLVGSSADLKRWLPEPEWRALAAGGGCGAGKSPPPTSHP